MLSSGDMAVDAAWWRGYGPPGEPTPRVFDSLLVGGASNGRRIHATVGARLRVPRPLRINPVVLLTDPEPQELIEVDEYERRGYRPCWSAAPSYLWVNAELSDEDATAIMQERVALPSGRDLEADFARAQCEAAYRRLRQLRDQIEDEGL